MEKINRIPAPDWLLKNWEKWGEVWKAKVEKQGTSKGFDWRQIDNRKVNHHLLEILMQMTQRHCSYCDAYPLGSDLEPTIDHFRPKSKYPEFAWQWENLFACCHNCQKEKREEFDDLLLKPDNPTFNFDDYFDLDWFSGDIIKNATASLENRKRAKRTIEILGLNQNGKPGERKRIFKNIKEHLLSIPLEELPYRFYLVRGM